MSKWDLRSLFKDDLELEEFAKNLGERAKDFNLTYKGRLKELGVLEFGVAMRFYEGLAEDVARVMSYVELKFSLDTTLGAFYAKFDKKTRDISEQTLFFELEFNELGADLKDKFIAHLPPYSYYLELVSKRARHQLSFDEEKVLLRTCEVGASAFSRLFDESMTRLEFEFRGESLKEEEILSKLHDENRDIRRDASISLSKTLEANSHLLSYIYNMIRADLKISCELRGYESGEEIMHEHNQIQKSSVDSLIKACEDSFGLVHRYYDKKREILGFDQLFDYDRYAPIQNDTSEFSYDEAKDIILKAFGEFDEEFSKIAKMAFDDGWIDVYSSKNKQSGAFSHPSISGSHPYVLMNFTNSRRDVFTLAHELGHAIHQYLAYKSGYLGSSTPLTTAETASVFCEMIVFDYLLKKTKNKKALIAGKLEDIFATLYRQINFTTFERRVHAKEGEISVDELNEIWLEESKKMFSNSLSLTQNYRIWWSYIPHFIHSPFYCYSYAYAQLLSFALFGIYRGGFSEFAKVYKEFLALGGSKNPKEMVGKFGFDIDDEGFWQIGLKEISRLVDEFVCK